VDPPSYGNCQSGPSQSCYDLRVLQYWTRAESGYGSWTRDPRLEVELLNMSELPELLQRNLAQEYCLFREPLQAVLYFAKVLTRLDLCGRNGMISLEKTRKLPCNPQKKKLLAPHNSD
jgi:hypothetical protein